ncbi:MAG: M20 family metallo-hydrolase, partial [Candidatus Aminicenantes bacterium]|nr:M20 family metallo-hydrolase [Candidatus Aminicenantes bacterium]
MDFDEIASRLDQYRNEMIDLQIKLATIPAIAPSSGGEGEARKADFLLEYLNKSDFVDIEVIKTPDIDAPAGYRPNILAFYRGRSSAKTIWIMTHMDVV